MATTTKTYTVVPAYGRDYKSAAEVRNDYEDGKDFTVQDISCPWDGAKVSIRECEDMGIRLRVRYNRLTEVVVL